MLEEYSQINHFLVKVFNEVLRTEEASLKTKEFHNLSLREMHVIEAVCDAVQAAKNTASEIASSQRITAGTLTTTINTLEKKGYVERRQDQRDKRVVRIYPTEKGKTANQVHASFHHKMVSAIMSAMNEEELTVFVKGLAAVKNFLESK
ncbi:MarR family transcriptional regulator [Caproiciproducens galactitolivorans]|uniref:Transcriptional repressor MprA n=1 Tax=Caproiciproducens galactitolivorans TaxID=642589 RepID=A0A4Z0XZP6_9FIRM|nr:MarR family transcriptional regulator [Caproiciproducens galactitolivorans]QEY35250.1 MarR family transcriptional regulator [Caproiciproducens galactitolivorans]TGJ76944.1 transcriptional repressor MprA [Caproiciproducens galactitolivorans]